MQGPDEILRRCVFDHERHWIMSEAHASVAGGHYVGKETVHNILQAGLWWKTIHVDTKSFYHPCDIFHITKKLSHRDKMPLAPQITLKAFDN